MNSNAALLCSIKWRVYWTDFIPPVKYPKFSLSFSLHNSPSISKVNIYLVWIEGEHTTGGMILKYDGKMTLKFLSWMTYKWGYAVTLGSYSGTVGSE
jgi:hypothetical protein